MHKIKQCFIFQPSQIRNTTSRQKVNTTVKRFVSVLFQFYFSCAHHGQSGPPSCLALARWAG